MELRVCALCGEERPVERPECLDGHGEDCPEAFCAACGAGVFLPVAAPLASGPPSRRALAAAAGRRPRGRTAAGRGPARRAS